MARDLAAARVRPGPDCNHALHMNDEPLAERHGYPAKVIVPGLFGEHPGHDQGSSVRGR